jgi:hypothetical protein
MRIKEQSRAQDLRTVARWSCMLILRKDYAAFAAYSCIVETTVATL